MPLTITTTQAPATDIGYLLHKNPDRIQWFELSFGKAHVFYPEATGVRCTVALLHDFDPVGLVRTRRGPSGEADALKQYVNHRSYVASSFLSVAIARVFASALGGTSKGRRFDPGQVHHLINSLRTRAWPEIGRKLPEISRSLRRV